MASSASDQVPIDPGAMTSLDDRGFAGQPRGLMIMFQTELWERFSYYGMRAILFYYLTDTLANHGLGIDKPTGLAIVSIYGAAVYLLSVVGGWFADRIVGSRRAVLHGGLIIMAGHVALAVPSVLFSFLGIALVAIGTGLLKPNVSALVGQLYDANDARRDSGFSIFYMGINLGAFIAPIIVGLLRAHWGYHAGFAAAAIGMAFSLVFYVAGRKYLRGKGDLPGNPLDAEARAGLPRLAGIVALAVAAAFGASVMWNGLSLKTPIDVISLLAFGTPIAVFTLLLTSPKVEPAEREHVKAYIPIWLAAMLFWMIFEQAATTMSRFAAERTEPSLLGFRFEPEFFQSINPIVIVLLAPVFAILWVRRSGLFPSTAQKMAIGLVAATASFLLLALASKLAGDMRAPAFWLALVFVVQTLGELCVSPIGLSATTLLAPKAFQSQMMALWFLASAAGQAITAQMVQLTQGISDTDYFVLMSAITGLGALLMFLIAPWVRRKLADLGEPVATGAH